MICPRTAFDTSCAEHRRILLAEDEMLIAMALADLLRTAGWQPTSVASLAQGLRYCETHRFDGAVLDINLRGEQVYPLAHALADCGTPLIFLTGYDSGHIERQWANVPVLEKPFDPDALLDAAATQFRRDPPDRDRPSD